MLEHEYTLLGGVSRLKIGRYLALVSATVSGFIVFVLLSSVDVAQRFGIAASLPPSILSFVGAGTVFTALSWILNRYAWRWKIINSLLQIPDLAGKWICTGTTMATDSNPPFDWSGEIIVIQTWDRIRVRLKTATSASNSRSAALIKDEADGWRLFYSYRNEPNIDQPELSAHRGFSEILFDPGLNTGSGEYFNGHGRYTFGTMSLERV
ncbi:hypothetical protein [Rhizobium leguminosarum]|uniref:Cap15 family cyclic dinucleotide receptor domain-containing protein n=1 Tax=Rhizobium leguminosarum TaxID=384 RepID=UPI00103DDF8A|nr:hypothetical protein [Rhizobium leguminosarum]TBY81736.1 hypothetical protein E0H32_15770 [Rhizobium leguminosarum bv. viciae]